ncbi:MAG: pilus assembly protein PilM [Bacillota bacterium]|nr:pilus assembly protein PilM [Bacillota bacterium]
MLSDKILGMDIGTKNMKFVLVKSGKRAEIADSIVVPTPEKSVFEGQIRDMEALASTIKGLVSEKKIKAKNMALSINSPYVVVREVKLPVLKTSEIAAAIEFELSQSFPGVGQTHSISYRIYKKTPDSMLGIVCFCPNKIIESYEELAEKAGVNLKYIDVHANSVAKAYNKFVKAAESDEPVMIIDIGHLSSQIYVLIGGKVVLSRNFSGGGASVDNLVSDHLKISREEAEAQRIKNYSDLSIEPDAMEAYIRLGYAAVEEQIRQTLDFCNYNKFKDGVKGIYLSGGGCHIPGLEKYFTETFRIPSVIARPMNRSKVFPDVLADMMPAIGSALRED